VSGGWGQSPRNRGLVVINHEAKHVAVFDRIVIRYLSASVLLRIAVDPRFSLTKIVVPTVTPFSFALQGRIHRVIHE
jgi:hypothetical protein